MSIPYKVLLVDPRKCTGCRICEMACSFRKEGVFSPTKARIHVLRWEAEGLDIPMVCWQCEDAPCMAVCPVKAIYRNTKTGAILIDASLCIGCRECMAVCPFGGITISETGEMIKCDLCNGDPLCVKLCPTKALEYTKPSKYILTKKRESALKISEILKPS